jgi:hypothetical protein
MADVFVTQDFQTLLITSSLARLLHCQLKYRIPETWADEDVAITLNILFPAFEISVLPFEISRIDSVQPLTNIAQDIIREAFFQQRK